MLFSPETIDPKEYRKMIKAKMTRKEAIECFKKHMPAVVNPERCIDFYIEAGMLEIIEEKTATEKFAAIAMKYIPFKVYINYMYELDQSNLKIVEK